MALEFAATGAAGMSAERMGWASELLRRHVETGRSPAATAVVARRGEIVFCESAGAQMPGGPPLRADHVWPVASAGKPFTAAVVMALAEEGALGLLDPIVTYLPELAGGDHDEVLVHHLLTHTTGWESAQRTHRIDATLAAGELTDPPPGRDLITHLFLQLAFDPITVAAPGALQDYDSASFELVGEIVRRVTGATMDAALRSRLLEPLGMTRSALVVDDDLRPELVQRDPDLPFGRNQLLSFEGGLWESSDSAAAGLHTSPLDLAVFGQMILDRGVHHEARVLAPSSVRALTTNRIPGVPAQFGDRLIAEGSWGYGFTVIQVRPFPWFCGGLVPLGSVAHPGAGGVSFWVDFAHEIVGVYFEVITEISEFLEPVSGIAHRFQDVITAAVDE